MGLLCSNMIQFSMSSPLFLNRTQKKAAFVTMLFCYLLCPIGCFLMVTCCAPSVFLSVLLPIYRVGHHISSHELPSMSRLKLSLAWVFHLCALQSKSFPMALATDPASLSSFSLHLSLSPLAVGLFLSSVDFFFLQVFYFISPIKFLLMLIVVLVQTKLNSSFYRFLVFLFFIVFIFLFSLLCWLTVW